MKSLIETLLRTAVAATLAMSFLAVSACETAPPAPPRGVVLVSLDTLRADHLGAYGYDRPTSPGLDALATESIVFEDMLAHAPNTPPSHMSMLTGLLPPEHAFQGYAGKNKQSRLARDIDPLATILERHDFVSGGFTGGGWVNGNTDFKRGFASYVGMLGTRLSTSTKQALSWIRDHPDTRFFVFLHTYQIHAPYSASDESKRLFVSPEYTGSFEPTPETLTAIRKGEEQLAGPDLQHTINLYDAGIRDADRELAEFVDALRDDGLLDEILLIITSDHGEEFMEHGSTGHWQIFRRPNLHVPFLVRLPDAERGGTRIRARSELVDLVPTTLDLLQLPPHTPTSGRSWAPAIRGGEPPAPRPAFGWPPRFKKPGPRSIIADGFQMILDTEDDSVSLFDLGADPMAQTDIAATNPEVVARMRAYWDNGRPKDRAKPIETNRKGIDRKTRRNLEALGYVQGED